MSFAYQPVFEFGEDLTPYRLITTDGVSTIDANGRKLLRVEPEALKALTFAAIRDISHLFRPGHLQQLAAILEDPEASENDRFVALQLLKNANVSAGMVLPSCQDTGTAIVIGKKGQDVFTDGADESAISECIARTYLETNLRYSQMAPLDMYAEKNTGNNLPAQIELYADQGDAYKFLFMTQGGGSANKTFLFQKTNALLNEEDLLSWIDGETRKLGTAACPPYHLAIVVGGMSAEFNLKTVKLASARYLDSLPTSGNDHGRAFRDLKLEEQVLAITRNNGIGAQFGGKYFCHDVRVIRLPRHGEPVPGLGERQVLVHHLDRVRGGHPRLPQHGGAL